jgi:hypothetical protein
MAVEEVESPVAGPACSSSSFFWLLFFGDDVDDVAIFRESKSLQGRPSVGVIDVLWKHLGPVEAADLNRCRPDLTGNMGWIILICLRWIFNFAGIR